MNLDSLSFVLSQISYLVTSLNKKNFKQSVNECNVLVKHYGPEAERHLLRCLFSQVDFAHDNKAPPSHQQQFLTSKCESLCQRPNFVSLLCYAVDFPLHHQKTLRATPQLLYQISKNLKLTPIRELVFSLALCHSSKPEIKAVAEEFFKKKFVDFVAESSNKQLSLPESDNKSELLHFILDGLSGAEFTQLNEEFRERFLTCLEKVLPPGQAPDILSPYLDLAKVQPSQLSLQLSPDAAMSSKSHLTDSSLPDLVLEIGYPFTSSLESCRSHLIQLGGPDIIGAVSVARIIGNMVRTHTGLDDSTTLQKMNATGTSLWEKDNEPRTWNIEVFIKAVHELQPTLHWKEIIYELDHPGFLIKDRQGLILLINALKLGLQAQGFQGNFPVDMFYRHWKNTEGQVSLFQQILRNPDVFCFSETSHHPAAIEVLKVQPDLENRELSSWKSLDLVEAMLFLAEAGHAHVVMDMMNMAKQHCPDVLALALMQINPPVTKLRQDILAILFQYFLGNHPNSGVILTHAWHSQSINLKGIVVHAMTEYYTKATQEGDSEHSRLSRILDVAQDLKALSVLLQMNMPPFVIDLAVLASRREYLNLEKWLTDQIREHQEAFVKAIIDYLRRKLPNIQREPLTEEYVSKCNFPIDCLPTLLLCLQQVSNSVAHQELREAIHVLIQNSQGLLSRPRPPVPPGVLPRPPVSSGAFGPTSTGPIRPTPRQGLPANSMFPSGPDPLAGLTSQFGSNLSLSTPQQQPGLPTSSSAFSLPGVLGPLVSGPGSPNRIFPPPPPAAAPTVDGSHSPFSAMMQQQQQPLPSTIGQNNSATTSPSVMTGGGGGAPGPALQNGIEQIRQGNLSNLFPEMTGPISKEVEDEANSYFQRIYNHPPHPTLTIDEVLELLKKFQESGVKRERDVFICMIRNLFEEYKYFPQYPDKELHITAQLFGGIIEHGLVTMIPLGLALRFVLEAVRKPTETNMYYFGIAALDRFKSRLKDYPQYCQHVSCIPHFKEFPPHLVEWVEHGALSQVPPNKPTGPITMPPQQQQATAVGPPAPVGSGPSLVASTAAPLPIAKTTTIAAPTTSSVASSSTAIARPIAATTISGRPSIANTTNIDTLLNARVEEQDAVQVPSDKIQDKVAFIFNNLSLMNMQPKTDELKEQVGDNYTSWLAQYLVMKRASIEPNFHTLYSNFLEQLNSEKLYKEVVAETFRNIKTLLRSDKSIANFSDRSLLKNLGHWLGLMTIARNIPILMLDLDIKPLIIEAYHNGTQELLYVVPFVAKVLESCAKSRVFKPPCPWTMGIMNLLCELHQEPDLKLNLKFEIEVLCKTMSLELSELRSPNLLKDFEKISKILGNAGFNLKMSQPPSMVSAPPHILPKDSNSFGSIAAPRGRPDPMAAMDPFAISASRAGPSMPSASLSGFAGPGIGNFIDSMPLPPTTMPPSLAAPPVSSVSLMQPTVAGSRGTLSAEAAFANSHDVQPIQQQQQQLQGLQGQQLRTEPKFNFNEISTSNLNGIVPHIQIDSRLGLLKEEPDLHGLVKIAIEKSITEWAQPVIERAIKIALTTSEQIVKKDFALDHDENRMRQSAHQLVRTLTAGMAMITCRDHLLLSIKNNLKNYMVTLGRNLTTAQTDAIEMTVNVIANDNVELACAFIQKKAVERAIPEIDKRLKAEMELRMRARKEGRRYCDPVALTYQAERMPDPIRLKVGGVSSQQNAVYDEFARHIPGFKPLTERETLAMAPKPTAVEPGPSVPAGGGGANVPPAAGIMTSEECLGILDEVISKIEPFVQGCSGLPTAPHMNNLHGLLEALTMARSTKEVPSITLLIVKAVEALLEGLTPNLAVDTEMLARYRDANLLVLRALADPRAYGGTWTTRQVTLALCEARDDIKYNLDAVDCLIRSSLVSLYEFDKHLAQSMAAGENQIATAFAMHLCKIYLIDDRSNAHIIESDLFTTIEALQKIASQSRNPPDGLINLIEMIKMSSERLEQNLALSGPTAQLHSGIQQAREFEDPPGLLEKTEFLLREWVNAYHSRDAGKDSRQAFVVFVQLMNQHGILKTDDLITRFFRISTQMCVDLCYRALNEQTNSPTLVRAKCFHTLDAYVRLITLLVKHSGETQNTITKVNLLNKVLGIVAGVLLIDHDVRSTDFQQVPYHRIFIMLFLELNSPDSILETINFQVLTAYCNMLHILRPAKAPGFAYAWLEVVSHRVFLGRLLAQTPQQKGWPMYAQLLIDLFKFLAPFLRNAELTKPVHRLYRGTLRVLLVLLHDFPEFLCDYHYGFCDVIPPNCIQMRNLILSAFPRNMRLPDPFTPNLKVDMLTEISIPPRMVTNYASSLKPQFKKDLDSYLKNRAPVQFLSELRGNLQAPSGGEPNGNRYNIPMINALVMHVGTSAITYIRAKNSSPNMQNIAHSSHMDIFQNLAVDLDTQGRYLFLNCIANQLRYPNSHTHYFSCTLLYLFGEANTEAIQEQITRVLLERLIVNRPHPWGLLITFIELIKNPSFKFWSHEFVHCAPEIQKLFESVARSCMVHAQVQRPEDAIEN